jgi:hypothetical protein
MQPIMYRFTTKDGQPARVDMKQIRSIVPSGYDSGCVKLVLDGGHAVTVRGTVDGVYELRNLHCLHASAPAGGELPQAMSLFRDAKYGDHYAAHDTAEAAALVSDNRGWAALRDDMVPIEDCAIVAAPDGRSMTAKEWAATRTEPGEVFPGHASPEQQFGEAFKR